jgi:citrate lyase synthetase
MRTRLVSLTTARTTAELFVLDFGKRLKFFNDIGFRFVLQTSVTAKTLRKGSDQIQKLEAANDVDGLFFGVL